MSWLAWTKTFSLLKCALTYGYELAFGHKQLLQMLRLRNTARHKCALVLGNGPSLGSLSAERLREFVATGGDIFAVNLWNENEALRTVAPTYLTISDPWTLQPNTTDETMIRLKQYLIDNPATKILCPIRRHKDISGSFGANRVMAFCDSDLRYWWASVNPLLPRGYISMTLYKSLAVARWLGYRKIFVLGMDNTYPRNIYCDRDNRILNLEVHAGREDYAADMADLYGSIGDMLHELAFLFYDAKKFAAGDRIVNLDPYSLTDAFPKVTIDNLRA
jgi:hypothetical protein